MNDKTLKLCRYMAGTIMVMSALSDIFYGREFNSIDNIAGLIFDVSCIVIAIALFTANTQYLLIGCGIGAFSSGLYVIAAISYEDIDFVIYHASRAACFILITLSLLQQMNYEKTIPMAILIGIAGYVVAEGLYIISNDYYDFFEKIGYVFSCVSSAVRLYLPIYIGFITLDSKNIPILKNRTISASAQSRVENPIERLTKLKTLLDSGVITQEEFEAKKKELLNL